MKSKRFSIALLAFIGLSSIAKSQSPSYLWAKKSGGNKDDATNSIAADANGNVFVGGNFTSASITYGTTTLYNSDTSATYPDISIVKYDAAGNVLWARSAGNNSWDEIFCITTDNGGNVIICGYFTNASITFGSYMLTNPFSGSPNVFITKFDPSGNVLWAHSAGGNSDDYGQSVTADPSGNIFMTGGFGSPSIIFGSTTLNNLSSIPGSPDMFIVGYDPAGNVIWAKSAWGNDNDFALSASADSTGNVTIAGFFSSPSITFDATTLTNTGSGGTYDFFLVKYLASGTLSWARAAGGTSMELARNVRTDLDANAYVTGYFSSSTITIGGSTLTNAGAVGTSDLFVAKYDSYGNPLWAKSAGGPGDDSGKRLAVDASSNVIVVGYSTSPTITFDSTSLTNAGSGTADIIFAKYNTSGNILWATSLGGTNNDYGWAISTNGNNETYVAGFFYSPSLTIGTTTLTNTDVSGISQDCFIAKLVTTPPCYANYSTTYDSTLNEFNITVDTATAASALSYFWDFGDGTSSTLPNPTHIYLVDSVYNVCMFVKNIYGDSCFYCNAIGKDSAGNIIRTGGFTINIYVPPLTNIPALTNPETNTIVYPNPGSGIFKFTSDISFSSIEVFNILGKQVLKSIQTGKEINEIDLSNQTNGIYVIKLNSKNKTITKKICIAK